MNNVYFSENGITSTEGNYLANISKELLEAANGRLANVRFFNTSVAVIGSNDRQYMSMGNTDLSFILTDLETVCNMNSFCAWIRESIKEKENQQRVINSMNMEEWATQQGIEVPVCPKYPKDPELISEKDIIDTWDINKRNKYLRLEACAASFGKYIHPNATFNEARKKAHEALNNPITTSGSGRDTILYYKTSSVDIKDVDKLFLNLQDKYRSYEKELNQMKAEIKETVNNLTRQQNDKFIEEVANWSNLRDEYNSRMSEYRNQFTTWRTNELERISKLKITIPDSLKATFKMLKEVGDTSK